jgi:hypothetical protein
MGTEQIVTIRGYRLKLDAGPDRRVMWFADPVDAPLNGIIGEVTQSDLKPHENWKRIQNGVGKDREAFAYWILDEKDEERLSEAFLERTSQWTKAGIVWQDQPIWCARTSWNPDSAYIPHKILLEILNSILDMNKT